MKNLIVTLFLFAAVLLNPSSIRAQALDTEAMDGIVAVVEDDVILRSELDRAVGNILKQYARNPEQLPAREVLEKQVLERLIMLRLQIQRAESTGVKVGDTEVDQALANLARQNQMNISELRASLENDGFGFEEFRKTMSEELMVQRLRNRVASRVQVTDTEMDILLASDSLKTGEVRLGHLLIGVADGAGPELIQAAREKAEAVKKEIDAGLDFSAAAIKYSQGQQALDGGDLGWRPFDEVPTLFADLVQGMNVGEVSQPMRGPSGFHMLKVIEKRDSGQRLIEEFHARHVMIKATELVSSGEALDSIKNIRERLVKGEDFAKLAKEFSEDDTTVNQGGDMGWFQLQQYGSRVAEVMSGLKDNEISEPFQTEVGWHVLQRLGQRKQDRTEDIARGHAKETIRNRKAEEEYENFLRQLRAESFIENRLVGA